MEIRAPTIPARNSLVAQALLSTISVAFFEMAEIANR